MFRKMAGIFEISCFFSWRNGSIFFNIPKTVWVYNLMAAAGILVGPRLGSNVPTYEKRHTHTASVIIN